MIGNHGNRVEAFVARLTGLNVYSHGSVCNGIQLNCEVHVTTLRESEDSRYRVVIRV
jgi:hypothetical protein